MPLYTNVRMENKKDIEKLLIFEMQCYVSVANVCTEHTMHNEIECKFTMKMVFIIIRICICVLAVPWTIKDRENEIDRIEM